MHETFNSWCEATWPNQSNEFIARKLDFSSSTIQAWRTLNRFPGHETLEDLEELLGDDLDTRAWQSHYVAEKRKRREVAATLKKRRTRAKKRRVSA